MWVLVNLFTVPFCESVLELKANYIQDNTNKIVLIFVCVQI